MKLSKLLGILFLTLLLFTQNIEVTDVPKDKQMHMTDNSFIEISLKTDGGDKVNNDQNINPSGSFANLETYGDNSENILDLFPDVSDYHRDYSVPVTETLRPISELEIINGVEVKENKTIGSIIKDAKNIHSHSEDKISGAVLEEFSPDKISSADTANTLPIFLTEPESVFVIKNRPAVLKCKAAHALQLHFKCSGSSQPPPSVHDKHVDPHTGVHVEEVTATIHRDLVDEYFGKGPFKCECHAWSSRGVVKSQAATVSIAYLRKQFLASPTSLRVEVGSRAELYCKPPNGFPEPKISWLKNNGLLIEKSEEGPFITPTGTLIFIQVSLQDMANYTCSAENIAGKRLSDSAVLIVYVNGGWSPWSPWKECKCHGKHSQGRKRVRSCNNPIPLNGGNQCSGPLVQKSLDCISCSDDTQIVQTDVFESNSNRRGRWSPWGEWSLCSLDCVQVRRRKCISIEDNEGISNVMNLPSSALNSGIVITTNNGANLMGNTKVQCAGKDIQTAECRGDYCPIDKNDFDWIFYLGIGVVSAALFALGVSFLWWAKRASHTNPQYNIARTEYIHEINKKDMRIHNGSKNDSYDYVNSDERFISSHLNMGSATFEHHYDVPNLPASYTNPIDELSGHYLTDTPESSTVDASNINNDIEHKGLDLSDVDGFTAESFGCVGGNLSLYNNEVMLFVPELAIGKNTKKYITLSLLNDDCNRVPIADSLLICSSIVQCNPSDFNFLKPVILKIPHCLTDLDFWNVNIFHADNDFDGINIMWRKIITVGEETINTPVFVQIETNHVYIMTEQLGRFVVVAQPKMDMQIIQPSINMKLIAFSQLTPSSANCSLRIYVVKNFPNSRDICAGIENQLGGSYMGESIAFTFLLNNADLNIRVCSKNSEDQDVDAYEHTIPYNHILSNNSILHCEFAIKLNEDLIKNLQFDIDFIQSKDATQGGELHCFSVSQDANIFTDIDRNTMVCIDSKGTLCTKEINDIRVKLPRTTKRLICSLLDPPRSDERDWRLLARKLNSDRYLAYFATKPSPTEQILNLWECRSTSSSHTVMELLMILKDMNRQDVMDIITDTIGPMWI